MMKNSYQNLIIETSKKEEEHQELLAKAEADLVQRKRENLLLSHIQTQDVKSMKPSTRSTWQTKK